MRNRQTWGKPETDFWEKDEDSMLKNVCAEQTDWHWGPWAPDGAKKPDFISSPDTSTLQKIKARWSIMSIKADKI